MTRKICGVVGVTAALVFAAGACAEDPLGGLDSTPAAIVTDFSAVSIVPGGTAVIRASVVDGRSTPLEANITFTACDANITVAPDASYQPVPRTSEQAIVTGVTAAPSCVNVAGGGLTAEVTINVLPAAFNGTPSSATPAGGSVLTLTSTSLLKFNPASVAVTFGNGFEGIITSATADAVGVLVPFGATGLLAIDGIDVAYVPGLTVSLPSAFAITQTGDAWSGDAAFATAPTITMPGAGQTTYLLTNLAGNNPTQCAEIVLGFGSTGPCVIYKFVVPAGQTLDITAVADWDSGADIDIYTCASTAIADCFEDGGSGATGAQPQEFSYEFPAGTHYFVIENYDGAPVSNIWVSFTHN